MKLALIVFNVNWVQICYHTFIFLFLRHIEKNKNFKVNFNIYQSKLSSKYTVWLVFWSVSFPIIFLSLIWIYCMYLANANMSLKHMFISCTGILWECLHLFVLVLFKRINEASICNNRNLGKSRRSGTNYITNYRLHICNCVWLCLLFCYRKLAGFYFFPNAFVCGIPASALSLAIERKERYSL